MAAGRAIWVERRVLTLLSRGLLAPPLNQPALRAIYYVLYLE